MLGVGEKRKSGRKEKKGWRKENSQVKHALACSYCKSAPLPKCPLYWSACVKLPFSCESALLHKYFTMPFLTPGGKANTAKNQVRLCISLIGLCSLHNGLGAPTTIECPVKTDQSGQMCKIKYRRLRVTQYYHLCQWFFIPYIFPLYVFAFQLCLCRKRLIWSKGYLEVIFHALDIFSITFATAYVEVKNWLLQGHCIVCFGYEYALPEVWKSSKQWSKTIKMI